MVHSWLLPGRIPLHVLCALALSPILNANPKAIDVVQSAGNLAEFALNFCNQTDMAAENGLQKTALGHFMGYPCSPDFFHCRWQSDGFHTYKKSCRIGLVFDTLGTQNCNYDYNVKTCGMQAPTEKCKNETDFSCPLSETCVPLGQRCDGNYDCVLEEDEQNCPMCKADEFPCVTSEQCIPMSGRCNGLKECRDGTDEMDCEACPADNFYCRKSNKCIPAAQRCDGHFDCPQHEDELLCKKASTEMYVCENRKSEITKDLVCDGKDDCPDGSDEKYCLRPAIPLPGPKSTESPDSPLESSTLTLATLPPVGPEFIAASVPPLTVPLPATITKSFGTIAAMKQGPSSGTGKLVFPRVEFKQGASASADAYRRHPNQTPEAASQSAEGAEATKSAETPKSTEATRSTEANDEPAGHISTTDPPAADTTAEDGGKSEEPEDAGEKRRQMKKYNTEIMPNCRPCPQDDIPVFIGQKGRKTFTTTNLNLRQELGAQPDLLVAPDTPNRDPLQALTDKYGTDRNGDYSELLRKIEEILRDENVDSTQRAGASEASRRTPEAFHRFSKAPSAVTGRPQPQRRWQPSLSTNPPGRPTTRPAALASPVA